MAGHRRSKDGVASARLCPAIHVLSYQSKKDVDARDICAKTRFALLPGHDEELVVAVALGIVEYPEAFLELRRDRDVELLPGGQARDEPFVVQRNQIAIRT